MRAMPLTLALLLALAAPGPAAAVDASAPPPRANAQMVEGFDAPILTRKVDGTVVIAPDGSVKAYHREPDAELPASVATSLDALVRGWRFEPVVIDGRAVEASTRMRVTLAARAQGKDGYAVGIDNVTFPPNPKAIDVGPLQPTVSMRGNGHGIHLPGALAGAGIDMDLLVHLRIGADGRVVDAMVSQTSFLNATGGARQFGKVAKQVEDAVLRASRRWRFDVSWPQGASPTGPTYDGAMPVSIRFDNPKVDAVNVWNTEVRSAKRIPSWVRAEDGDRLAGVSDLRDGEVAGAHSPYRLRSAVRGVSL